MLKKYENKWNQSADKYNQWAHELDCTEKCEFIISEVKKEINDVIENILLNNYTLEEVIKKLKQIVGE
jgi:hypothetical protein